MTEALNDNKFDELANTITTQGYRVIEVLFDSAHEMDSAAKDDLIGKMADLHSTMYLLESHIVAVADIDRVFRVTRALAEARATPTPKGATVSLSRHAAADLTRKTD